MVRDQALALSGLLSQKVGGPSVFPPQPEGLWQAAFNGERTWSTSQGEDRYRRGLYTFWRRTVPYPSMAVFDAPSREICAIRRVRTNTPLQSLVTLNDPVYVEAAQALARRIVREGGTNVAIARSPWLAALPVPAAAARAGRAPGRPLHQGIRAIPQEPGGRRGPGHRPARASSSRHGTGRSGCLDHRRQRTLESRFGLDQRLILMDLDLPWKLQLARAQTRRQFLKTSQAGLGAIALGTLMEGKSQHGGEPTPARRPRTAAAIGRQPDDAPAAPLRAQGQASHLSAYVGRAASARPVRFQARARQAPLAALPRFAAQEPEIRLHQRAPQAARLALQVREMRAKRRRRERALASPSRRGRRHRHRPVDVHRSVQPCAGRAVSLHRLIAQRRGRHGLVDHLRAGLGKPGPARVRRLDQRRDRSDRRQGPLEHRLSAQRLPGGAMPDRRRSDPLRQRPQGNGPGRSAAHARRSQAAQRL